MVGRWITVGVFALIAVVVFILFSTGADNTADRIRGEAEANERLAESAPQQQVVASWAIMDAELTQVSQNGVRNGLLGASAAMLTSIAVSLAIRDQRDRRVLEGPSPETGPVPPPAANSRSADA